MKPAFPVERWHTYVPDSVTRRTTGTGERVLGIKSANCLRENGTEVGQLEHQLSRCAIHGPKVCECTWELCAGGRCVSVAGGSFDQWLVHVRHDNC